MIYMRVAQNDRIYFRYVERKRVRVQSLILMPALATFLLKPHKQDEAA